MNIWDLTENDIAVAKLSKTEALAIRNARVMQAKRRPCHYINGRLYYGDTDITLMPKENLVQLLRGE